MTSSTPLGNVRRFFLFTCLAFLGTTLFPAFSLEVGDTPEAVIEEMGKPSGTGVIGGKQFWQYPRGQIVFKGGAVISWSLESEEDFARRQMAQRARAQAAARHQAEGEQMIANLRGNPNFALATPDRQIEALRRFQARYPKVAINDLLQNAVGAKRAEQQAAAQAAQAAAAAAAAARLQERELAALQERNRQLERENARREDDLRRERQFNNAFTFGGGRQVYRFNQGYPSVGNNGRYYPVPPVLVLPSVQVNPAPEQEPVTQRRPVLRGGFGGEILEGDAGLFGGGRK